ncbi:MAG: efflux RND transporter periplasmic adaptor subunit [Planctomycetota bacterium]|jgi:RND family efflux transporter MFP subunit
MKPGNRNRTDLSFSVQFIDLTILIFIFFGPTFFIASCGKKEEPPPREVVRPVKMMTVTSSSEAFKRRLPGTVRAAQRVDLAFQVGGPLIELPVEEGQNVKKGQLLARIDPRDFQVNLRNAEGQQAKAKAALQRAQKEYDRIVRIRKQDPGAASESMVDRRRADLDKAKADIKSLQATVEAAKDKLDYTYLRAPFSGIIATRYVDNFQEVRAKQPVVTLDDLSHVEILVDVPENAMATVRAGNVSAFAEFTGAPDKRYEVNLKEYSTRADPKTQTYRVVLTMPAPEDIRVLPGMTATVEGTRPDQEKTSDRFVTPAIAVFADETGASHVWVYDKETMTVQRRKVITGNLTGTGSIEIVGGLATGDMIAVSGVSMLREGMKVKPVDKIKY